jgi:hypothetical protein
MCRHACDVVWGHNEAAFPTSFSLFIITMKSVVFASLVASAAAFAPQQTSRSSTTSLNEFVRGYAGADSVEPMFIGATGSKNFDPIGLAEVCIYIVRFVAHVLTLAR